ncbi:MAG: hypothetical protein ABJD11_07115 [Gemmatimonadota bacterium]
MIKPALSRRLVISAIGVALAGAAFAGGMEAERFSASEPQPHMRLAIESLRAAKNHLKEATPDKAEHRVKAMDLVDQAISEVQAGINAANAH